MLSACGGGGGGGTPTPPPAQRVSLNGQVVDRSGDGVANAQVLLGLQTTSTDAQGRFSFDNLPAGSYTYTIQGSNWTVLDYGTVELRQPQESMQFPASNERRFEITFVDPQLNSQGWPLGAPLELGFSDPVDAATLRPQHFVFAPDIGPFVIRVDEQPFNDTVYLQPERQLPPNLQVTLTISGDIRSEADELLRQPLRTRFRTATTDESPPTLVRTSPEVGSTDWPINLAVRFEFNEPLAAEQPQLQVEVDPPTPVHIRVSGSTLLVIPDTEWERDTRFTIRLLGVADPLGNTSQAGTVRAIFTSGSRSAPVANIQPEWNRSRGEIVFASNRAGEYNVYSVQPDGSALTQLTFGVTAELHPTLSADGALLAWQARGDGGDWDVFVGQRADTSGARAVTAPGVNDTEPVFTRTSSRNILFVSSRLGTPVIHRMGPDGSGVAPLASTYGNQRSPAPHPLIDNQLLFVGTTDLRRDIYTMSVSAIDGSATVLRVSELRLSDEFDPDWGPDASFIAYVSDFSGARELWVRTLGAPQGRQVTELGAVSGPSLAPTPGDSRCVVSVERIDGGSDLVIIDVISGASTINLTAESGD